MLAKWRCSYLFVEYIWHFSSARDIFQIADNWRTGRKGRSAPPGWTFWSRFFYCIGRRLSRLSKLICGRCAPQSSRSFPNTPANRLSLLASCRAPVVNFVYATFDSMAHFLIVVRGQEKWMRITGTCRAARTDISLLQIVAGGVVVADSRAMTWLSLTGSHVLHVIDYWVRSARPNIWLHLPSG